MTGPAWKRWTAGLAVGAGFTRVAGIVFVYAGLEVGRGVLGFVFPIAVCCVAGSIAVKVAGR